jgi:hypothetical protein
LDLQRELDTKGRTNGVAEVVHRLSSFKGSSGAALEAMASEVALREGDIKLEFGGNSEASEYGHEQEVY